MQLASNTGLTAWWMHNTSIQIETHQPNPSCSCRVSSLTRQSIVFRVMPSLYTQELLSQQVGLVVHYQRPQTFQGAHHFAFYNVLSQCCPLSSCGRVHSFLVVLCTTTFCVITDGVHIPRQYWIFDRWYEGSICNHLVGHPKLVGLVNPMLSIHNTQKTYQGVLLITCGG